MIKKILIKFYQFFLLIIFLLFYPLLQVKYFLDWALSNIIYLRKGNHFFKNFLINKPFVKKIRFQDTNIKVLINSFYDVWRIGGYKNFFLNDLFDDAKKEKIYYYDIGANTGFSTIIASKKLSDRIESFAIETCFIHPSGLSIFSELLFNIKFDMNPQPLLRY